jgi:lipid-A-disaccharide synthase
MSIDLFVFAGEKSADMHGAAILKSLKEERPDLQITGVGGPKMRAAGMQCLLQMEEFQVMGFIDVFFSLPSLLRHFYKIVREILRLQPKIVLTIDYPGFNLRLAKALRKRGYKGKIVHFICPSVWAWGKKRIKTLADNMDLLLCVLPFEPALFSHTRLTAIYVGHPLVEKLRTYTYKPFSLNCDKKILALFPGSRKKEIERNLPLQLDACHALADTFHIALSISDPQYTPLITSIVQKKGLSLGKQLDFVSSEYSYELMRSAHLSFAKSGTVTLELALHKTPTIVTYAVTPIDAFIAHDLLRIRLPFYSLPNIIAQKEIFPEYIGKQLTKEGLLAHAHTLLEKQKYQDCQRECSQLSTLLGETNTSTTAAQQLLPLLLNK